MAKVLLGMGSNIDAAYHLMQAAQSLRQAFSVLRFSSVYQSPAIGMDGDDFLNACCVFDSAWPEKQLKAYLKDMEDAQGRDRSKGSWKPRTLDLDVLMYDGVVVDEELYRYAHACVPAAEVIELEVPDDCEGEVRRIELRL